MSSDIPVALTGLPRFLTFYLGKSHRRRATYEVGDDCLHAILRRIRQSMKCDIITARLEPNVDEVSSKKATCYRVDMIWTGGVGEAQSDWLWIPKTANHQIVDAQAHIPQTELTEILLDQLDVDSTAEAA